MTVSKVLAHHRYWTVPFLRYFVNKISSLVYEDADRAATMVEPLGLLAERVPVLPGHSECYQNENERRSWWVYAWAVRSTTNLVASRLNEGRYSLEVARKHAATGPIDREASGELYRRIGLYQSVKQDPRAIATFSKAIEVFEGYVELGELLALAYAGRGQAYQVVTDQPHEALLDYCRALEMTTTTDRGRRTAFVAVHNIGCLMAAESNLEALDYAEYIMKRTRRMIRGSATKMLAVRAKLLWAEAMILCRFQISVHAVRQLTKARDLFVKAKDYFSAAVADIDVIHMHLMQGDKADAATAYRHLRQLMEQYPELEGSIPARWKRLPSRQAIAKLQARLRGAQCQVPPALY